MALSLKLAAPCLMIGAMLATAAVAPAAGAVAHPGPAPTSVARNGTAYHPYQDYLGSTLAHRGGAATRAPSAARRRRPHGIDVSHHNGYIHWGKVKHAGIKFVYIKATEGNSFRDPRFTHNYNGSRRHGIRRGAYHFAQPTQSGGHKQARFFVRHGGGWSADGKTLPPMVDLEGSCHGWSHKHMRRWVSHFVHTVKKMTRRYPVIYTNRSWWNDCTGHWHGKSRKDPLFIAHPGSGTGALPGGWNVWTIWQYTFTGKVRGVPTAVDRDVFNGSMRGLRRLTKCTAKHPHCL